MKNTVLGFAGGIASGKSSVSAAVASALGCARTSFGDQVRSVADERDLAHTRDNLQMIGEELVTNDPEAFCRAVLQRVNWKAGTALVIDGIRHPLIVTILKKLISPTELRLIFVQTGLENRANRLARRGEDNNRLAEFDQHSTEKTVHSTLLYIADKVFDGGRPLEDLVADIQLWTATFS